MREASERLNTITTFKRKQFLPPNIKQKQKQATRDDPVAAWEDAVKIVDRVGKSDGLQICCIRGHDLIKSWQRRCGSHRKPFATAFDELSRMFLIFFILLISICSSALGAIFPDRDLDALCRETLTKCCTLNDTWETLCRVDPEAFREARGKDRRLVLIDDSHRLSILASSGCRRVGGNAYIDEGETESMSILEKNEAENVTRFDIPESSFCSDR